MKKGINYSLIGMFLLASLFFVNTLQAEEAKDYGAKPARSGSFDTARTYGTPS